MLVNSRSSMFETVKLSVFDWPTARLSNSIDEGDTENTGADVRWIESLPPAS